MNQQLKKGVIELILLNLIKEKEMYGYEISQFINEHIHFKESSIYIILSRLEQNGYITVRKDKSPLNNKIVKYFLISKSGQAYLEDMQKQWDQINNLLNLVSEE